MQFVFVGSHPALDFLNTTFTPHGEPVETIGDGHTYLDWFVHAGLVEGNTARVLSRRRIGELDTAAAEARKVRVWARAWLIRWQAAPESSYLAEVAALNKLAARGSFHRQVMPSREGLVLREQSRIESAAALIALVAEQFGFLVTREQPSLIKRCAGQECSLWFLDRTKAHRRVFCSATTCGNRAKVAAFRQRQRR